MFTAFLSFINASCRKSHALWDALEQQNVAQVKAILDSWFAPNWRAVVMASQYQYLAPLERASASPQILDLLLQHFGSQISKGEIRAAIGYAFDLQYHESVKRLLATADQEPFSLMAQLAAAHDVQMLEILLHYYSSNIDTKYIEDAIFASLKKRSEQVVKKLFQYHIAPQPFIQQNTLALLECACDAQLTDLISFLFSLIAPESLTKAQFALLTYAIKGQHAPVSAFLIQNDMIRLLTENERYEVLRLSIQYRAKPLFNEFLKEPTMREIAHFEDNYALKLAQTLFEVAVDKSSIRFFQHVIDTLMQIESVVSIEDTSPLQKPKDFQVIDDIEALPQGPLNKNLETQELEAIAKIIVQDATQYHFYMQSYQLFVQLNVKMRINLSRLLKAANLLHVELTKEDSDYWLPQPASSEESLAEDFCLPERHLTPAERQAIKRYTDESFVQINDLLCGQLSVESTTSERLCETFLDILFLASALNKIMPSWHQVQDPQAAIKTYRGERSISAAELTNRKGKLQAGAVVIQQESFASTSKNAAISNGFSEWRSRLDFAAPYGKSLHLLTTYADEEEYLLLPGQFCLTGVTEAEDMTIFQARVISPLVNQYRSVNQQNRLKKLINQWNLKQVTTEFGEHCLAENLYATSPHHAQLSDLLVECGVVYQTFLIKPYTDAQFTVDWELRTPMGLVVRPNHGLAHVMRVAHCVPVVAEFLKQHTGEARFHFSARDIYMVQLTALFSVVGRKSDAGFLDMKTNQAGYKDYKQASSSAFASYVRTENFLDMSSDEIQHHAYDILTMGEPGVTQATGILLALAHKLDLLRCYHAERVQKDILEPFSQYLPEAETLRLFTFAEALLHATGDRVFYGMEKTGYRLERFYRANTDPTLCLEQLLQVDAPLPAITSILSAPACSSVM